MVVMGVSHSGCYRSVIGTSPVRRPGVYGEQNVFQISSWRKTEVSKDEVAVVRESRLESSLQLEGRPVGSGGLLCAAWLWSGQRH